MTDALLPPPLAHWPAIALRGDAPAAAESESGYGAIAALARIRAERLFWPAPRSGAARPRALALDAAGLAAARAAHDDRDIAQGSDLAGIDPERLERIYGAGGPAMLWARIGGLAPDPDDATVALLATARCVSPWTGAPIGLDEAVEAQALLRGAAMAARGPATLIGMSAWKRRCLRPFFIGPDGPPTHVRTAARAATGRPSVVWGAQDADGALRVEDGFLRSVGLGLRHTPPVSLVIDARPPHFDATQPNGFEALVAETAFTPALRERARRLAARIVDLGLTKYNLDDAAPLPAAGGREAILVAGQVATDASVRLGARLARDDLGLLEAARARFPDAFLLYKPHPDVVTGLRAGAAPPEAVARLADATLPKASAQACLAWADRVVVNTSLIGFEALMRGKAVTTIGRPFYAGWGLTDDVDPPPRARSLTLDELLAAALILYPSYVDPETGLPAPPEIAVEALARERARAGRLDRRLRRFWRDGISWLLNRI